MVVYRKDPDSVLQDLPVTGITAAEEGSHDAGKTPPTSPQMEPRAVLTSRPNSHPFQDRHLSLDQPVKVGRSVARCRPAHYNAIFDCKVLSRNHALLWYENGKFYLQDTKSSNGTFVNNQRLSKGSEESPAREVCSGDIVQFGVDVVENSRKVVHGCIVATLKLYLPDGKEAKASPTTAVVPLSPETSVSSQELYQLSQYLQEALHREQILENKLGTLQKVVSNTQDESDIGWKALIEEDRLLSRIETLESQLQTCGKNITEEKLKDDVMKLQEDKDKYQIAAKESLKKVLQEKLEAIRKVQDLENSLSNTENECSHLVEMNNKKEQEIQLLLEKSADSEKEIANLTAKLQDLEDKHQDLLSQNAEDKLVLENNTEEMRKEEQILSAKIEALQAENEFTKEQLSAMKAHFDILKKDNDVEGNIERNGNLSSDDHIDSAEETERKLIQHLSREVNRLSLELERVQTENRKNEAHIYTDNEEYKSNGDVKPSDYVNKLQADIQQLKKVLSETKDSKRIVDGELVQVKAQLDDVQTNAKKVNVELRNVQEQLFTARQQLKEKSDQVLELECKLISLIKASESEKELGKDYFGESSQSIKDLKEKLFETQGNLSGAQPNLGKITSHSNSLDSESDNTDEECAIQQEKVKALEADLIKCTVENSKLEAQNKILKNTCTQLEAAKLALEQKDGDYWNEHTVITKAELAHHAQKLLDAQEEIILVKERYEECNKEKSYLHGELNSLKEQLQLLSVQSKTVSVCSVIPLIILAVAMMLAFYPTLSQLTATSDQM